MVDITVLETVVERRESSSLSLGTNKYEMVVEANRSAKSMETVRFCSCTQFGSVAQLVERWPEEPSVGGSNPPRSTINEKYF